MSNIIQFPPSNKRPISEWRAFFDKSILQHWPPDVPLSEKIKEEIREWFVVEAFEDSGIQASTNIHLPDTIDPDDPVVVEVIQCANRGWHETATYCIGETRNRLTARFFRWTIQNFARMEAERRAS